MIQLFVDIDEDDYVKLNGISVIADRYNGTWSGGKFTAWNMPLSEIPYAVVDNDVPCREFWCSTSKEYLIGIGDTPQEAYDDLIEQMEEVGEVKRCPICGSKAELMEYEIDEDDWFYGFMHYVFCPKCGIRTENDWSKKEVMRKWNNRELE